MVRLNNGERRGLSRNRAEIDEIDRQLLMLINQRADRARRVEIKLATSQSGDALFYCPEREAQILRAIQQANLDRRRLCCAHFPRNHVELFGVGASAYRWFLVPRAPIRGGYQHFGQSAIHQSAPTIRDVFRQVEDRVCDMAVVPVENSTEGMVGQTPDCF